MQTYSNNHDGFVIGNRLLNLRQYLLQRCKEILVKSSDNLLELWNFVAMTGLYLIPSEDGFIEMTRKCQVVRVFSI
jgi:hypothetical protein